MSNSAYIDNSIIIARNLYLERQQKQVLYVDHLTITKGKTTMVMGHNGAGKTLLLSVLHGLIDCPSAKITCDSDVTQKMVFQRPILLRRTALAHFQFTSSITDHKQSERWFQLAGIADKMMSPARHLSSGEGQKLALISALASKPDIIFLDEPTANLDPDSCADVERLLHQAKTDGTTILMVTHRLAQAQRLADHIIFMNQGQICDDKPASIFLSGSHSAQASAFLSER